MKEETLPHIRPPQIAKRKINVCDELYAEILHFKL